MATAAYNNVANTNTGVGAAGADPEQDKWLFDANEFVKKQGFYMKRALDSGNVRDALKHAANMTGELRTSRLSPKNYYELYMNITDELRELEMFLEEEDNKADAYNAGTSNIIAKSIVELYEQVQYAGNIIPRLYLLITVASVYIKTKKAPARDILFDLVELCRGVQHPMRGLFLRNYLSQMSKDKIPDTGSVYEGEGGTFEDSVEFIVQNFSEMNKLWVRLQHQGAVRDKARREKERRNLRQLVGTNLVRLSEMNGVNLESYTNLVLPRVLEQIINCKDVIAQEYLMDAILQVFPVDFHLHTLDPYLDSCSQLQENVNVKDIIIALMNKLAAYAAESPNAIPREMEMFPLFHKYTSLIISNNTKLSLKDQLELQVALLNFATKVYPERLDYVDNVLGFSVTILQKSGNSTVPRECVKQTVELLSLPLSVLLLQILTLANYAPLMQFLELEQRRQVSSAIMTAILTARAPLDTVENVDTLLRFIACSIKDENTNPNAESVIADEDRFEFDQEQQLVARLFHLMRSDDTDVHYQILATARKHFGLGGQHRIEYTLPPLVYGSLELALRIHAREQANDSVQIHTKKVFGFVHETISVLSSPYSECAFRLFISAAQCADRCGYDGIAYEFVTQAFICYEEEIADSKAQFAAITLMVASLATFVNLSTENYDTLVSKATQHSAKLLKKTDQCRAVYQCAHVFWPMDERQAAFRDEKRVLACLQRSLKIANGCIGQQVHLFVEILNKYVFFYDRNCPSVTVKYLKGLISLIDEHIKTLDDSDASRQVKQHYENTRTYIESKQSGDDGARYRAIMEGGDGGSLEE
jgi:vacuolar protein sorting-associated protein 35